VSDPISQLILGILTRDCPESKAREALDRLRSLVVDYNELRVVPPLELARIVGDYPEVRTKCEDVSRALNRIFAIEHAVSLERLKGMSPKDASAYLARVDGLEAYSRARVRLLGLEQHAIPLDEAMFALVRRDGLVDGKCTHEEAQHFLERQIDREDALEFVALLRRHAWSEMAPAVRKREVERISSVPPDRTTSNMLQMLASGGSLGLLDEVLEPAEAEPAPAKSSERARRERRSERVRAAPAASVRGAVRTAARKARAAKPHAARRSPPGRRSSARSA
jgi:endonuclease III